MPGQGTQLALKRDGQIVAKSVTSTKLAHAQQLRIEYTADPRDVPLSKPQRFIRWALGNFPWYENERKVLHALLLTPDPAVVAKILGIQEDYAIRMFNRARSEVRIAAKRIEYEEQFFPPGWTEL